MGSVAKEAKKVKRGTAGDENFGFNGITPSETHQFCSICLLPVGVFATFFFFFFSFSFFSPIFRSHRDFGEIPPPPCFHRL